MELSPFSVIMVLSLMLFAPIIDAASTKCKKIEASSAQIYLTCNSSQWIHVISESSGDRTSEQGCLNKANSCTKVKETDSQSLIVNCNGKQNCSENLKGNSDCMPVRGYEIRYECVQDSIDVCSTLNRSTERPIYLHSPNFPESPRVNVSCNCRITGLLVKVLLIEHRNKRRNLIISTDGDNGVQGETPYNRNIVQRASYVTLNYHVMDDGRFWIQITGTGEINVQCGQGLVILSTPDFSLSSTVTPASTSQNRSTESEMTESQETDSTTAATETKDTDGETSQTDSTTVSTETKDTDGEAFQTDSTTVSTETKDTDGETFQADSTTVSTETKDTDGETSQTAKHLSAIAIASIGAAGCFVVVVLFIVAVICCRHKRKSKVPMEHNNSDPVELGHINKKLVEDSMNGYSTDHTYFQADPAFISLETNEEHSSVGEGPTSSIKSSAQHAEVVLRNSSVPVCDNDTSRTEVNQANDPLSESVDSGIDSQDLDTEEKKCDMVENNFYVGGPASKEQIDEGMVDNFLYHTFKHSGDDSNSEAKNPSHETPVTEQSIYREDELNDEEGMVISDLYHSNKSPSVDQHGSRSPQTDHRFYSDDEGTSGGDQGDGMVVSDLDHNCQPSRGDQPSGRNIPGMSAQIEQPNDSDGQNDDIGGMVINDLYHSYQSSVETQNPNEGQESHFGTIEDGDHPYMIQNDLYYSDRKPSKDEDTQRVSGGHYEEIVDDDMCSSHESEVLGEKPRPAVYEEIAGISSATQQYAEV